MNKGRSLQNLLRDHNVTADDFLETPGITAQIRSNLSRFVDYCRKHRCFTIRMIELALNISYEQLEDKKVRTASYAANDIFANEETEIAELFFEPPSCLQSEKNQITEEIVEGIQSEAERLFRFDEEQEDLPPQELREIEIEGQEMVTLSFQILKKPQKNETCLGHLQKMYSFFIRHQPIPVLAYFDSHREILDLLLANIRYSSVSSMLAQLLSSEDKKKEYKYQGLKRQILKRAMDQIFAKLDDQCFFDGAMVFLDEVLSATKQSYYQYFQDFKRISNYLVSYQVLRRFYDSLFKLQEPSFCSSSRFLQNLFGRMNSEAEDNRYYHKEESEQSMSFEIDIFLKNIPALMQLTSKLQGFSSLTKIPYLCFLDALFNTTQVKANPPSILDHSFLHLFEAYRAQPAGGMCKSKIYTLISGLLARATEQQIKQFMDQHQQIYEQYFTSVKGANYSNTKLYNKNESSAFDVSLIAKLTRKQQGALAVVSKVMGKDLRRMCKKYDTKIASFQSSNTFSLEEEFNFYQPNNETGKNKEEGGFAFVGKNNISIPVLHLPDRFNKENKEGKEREHSPEMPANELSDSPKEIVEVEEVVSLADKFGQMPKLDILNIKKVESLQENEDLKRLQEEILDPMSEQLVLPSELNFKKIEQMKKGKGTSKKEEVGLVAKAPMQAVKLVAKKVDLEKVHFFVRHLEVFS